MTALPSLTDAGFEECRGIWRRPGEDRSERWSADAAVDPIHAAIATSGEEGERTKSAVDIEFLVRNAVDGFVLDLGCGYGRVAKYLLPLRTFDGYVGIDGSLTMLELFRDRYEASPGEQATPLRLIHGSIAEVEFPDGSFDNVVISAVLLHNPKEVTRRVVAEVRRLLRPGGRAIVLSDLPNSRTPAALPNQLYTLVLGMVGRGDENGPVRTYSRREVAALFAEFRYVQIHTKGHAVLPKRLPGLPATANAWYRKNVHDSVQDWSEARVPRRFLDRMYRNVTVRAIR